MKLFGTIASIFSAKARRANRKLQVSNCIDLVDEQQLKLAKAYKKLTVVLAELKSKLDAAEGKAAAEGKPEVKAILGKNVEIIKSTIERINKNKSQLADKLQKSEDTKAILVAKKSLLDSIESLKGMSSNVFESDEFDVDAITSEIDTTISQIEAEFQADDELNRLAGK